MIECMIRAHAPMHLTAIERSSELVEWVKSWAGHEIMFLKPAQWFIEGHDLRFEDSSARPRRMVWKSGTHVWSPPPVVAHIALEQLRIARLKRQNSTHIVLIPKMVISKWR